MIFSVLLCHLKVMFIQNKLGFTRDGSGGGGGGGWRGVYTLTSMLIITNTSLTGQSPQRVFDDTSDCLFSGFGYRLYRQTVLVYHDCIIGQHSPAYVRMPSKQQANITWDLQVTWELHAEKQITVCHLLDPKNKIISNEVAALKEGGRGGRPPH